MKQLTLIATLLFSLSSLATSIQPDYKSADLQAFSVKHSFIDRVNSGNIRIDLRNKDITLAVSEKISCLPHMACIQIAPVVETITLPIVKIKKEACGETVYTAQTNVDSSIQTLKVTDYSFMTCDEDLENFTSITYKTHSLKTDVTIKSEFQADRLADYASHL